MDPFWMARVRMRWMRFSRQMARLRLALFAAGWGGGAVAVSTATLEVRLAAKTVGIGRIAICSRGRLGSEVVRVLNHTLYIVLV